MRYCGVIPMQGGLQLSMLEEVRTPEPPIRLSAVFFEPGSPAQVAAELRRLDEAVVGLGAPLGVPLEGRDRRDCDVQLAERGVTPQAGSPEMRELAELLADLPSFRPSNGATDGSVAEGSYHEFPLFETNADGVFCALQGRRLPAKRHPLGLHMRLDELAGDHVLDEGGDLWHRRIEELDAAACALCAHRYAVGHASWLGDPEEGVVVLPGSSIPEQFSSRGVMPPVERLKLPAASGA
jgi:predicted nuclease with RNAse H fold